MNFWLPSQSTPRDYTYQIPAKVGFQQKLADATFLSQKLNKYVLLVMD